MNLKSFRLDMLTHVVGRSGDTLLAEGLLYSSSEIGNLLLNLSMPTYWFLLKNLEGNTVLHTFLDRKRLGLSKDTLLQDYVNSPNFTLQAFFTPNGKGHLPLHIAIEKGDKEVVEYLLELPIVGIDLFFSRNKVTEGGVQVSQTPLEYVNTLLENNRSDELKKAISDARLTFERESQNSAVSADALRKLKSKIRSRSRTLNEYVSVRESWKSIRLKLLSRSI